METALFLSNQKMFYRTAMMSYKVLNHILNERRPLTTQTAMMLEAALDIPADSLIRIQEEYNKQTALMDKSFTKRLAEIRKIAAVL